MIISLFVLVICEILSILSVVMKLPKTLKLRIVIRVLILFSGGLTTISWFVYMTNAKNTFHHIKNGRFSLSFILTIISSIFSFILLILPFFLTGSPKLLNNGSQKNINIQRHQKCSLSYANHPFQSHRLNRNSTTSESRSNQQLLKTPENTDSESNNSHCMTNII